MGGVECEPVIVLVLRAEGCVYPAAGVGLTVESRSWPPLGGAASSPWPPRALALGLRGWGSGGSVGTDARLTATTHPAPSARPNLRVSRWCCHVGVGSRVVEVGVATGVGPDVVCDGRRQASPTRMSW